MFQLRCFVIHFTSSLQPTGQLSFTRELRILHFLEIDICFPNTILYVALLEFTLNSHSGHIIPAAIYSYHVLHRESKKGGTLSMAITLLVLDQFAKKIKIILSLLQRAINFQQNAY